MIKLVFSIFVLFQPAFSGKFCKPEFDRVSKQKCYEYNSLISNLVTNDPPSLLSNKCIDPRDQYDCKYVEAGFIAGGVITKAGEFPHMAAIGWKGKDGKMVLNCGGVLISERYVLTAAHCDSKDLSVVVLGAQNLVMREKDTKAIEIGIKRFIKHEEYNCPPNPNDITEACLKNDIALIELAKDVVLEKGSESVKLIRPACLQQTMFNETSVIATGWGQNGTSDQTSDDLMKVRLSIQNIDDCQYKLKDEESVSNEAHICAGMEEGKNTCKGDSGGPIQTLHNGCLYNVVGLTSIGFEHCTKNVLTIYTRVSNYLEWIEKKVWPEGLKKAVV